MDHDSCQNCRFIYIRNEVNGRILAHVTRHYCRRYPPINGRWPIVDLTDWCGEFQKKGLKAVPASQIKPVLYDEDYLPELDDDYGMIRHTNGLPD